MAENTKISWADHTFNCWLGCSRVSPGCLNCYAENQMDHRYHRVKWGPGQPRSLTKTWNQPRLWHKRAIQGICPDCHGKGHIVTRMMGVERHPCNHCNSSGHVAPYRPKVFCASLADWLDEEVPQQWRENLFELIAECHQLDWLMLTKRIENYATMVPPTWISQGAPTHVWLGVTAENQKYWDIRVPKLSAINCGVRWVSYEPALGPLDISSEKAKSLETAIDWLIIGGESDQMTSAREFDTAWASDLIKQCRDLGIVPFVKQVGPTLRTAGVDVGRLKDKAGADPEEWPENIRVREFPCVSSI